MRIREKIVVAYVGLLLLLLLLAGIGLSLTSEVTQTLSSGSIDNNRGIYNAFSVLDRVQAINSEVFFSQTEVDPTVDKIDAMFVEIEPRLSTLSRGLEDEEARNKVREIKVIWSDYQKAIELALKESRGFERSEFFAETARPITTRLRVLLQEIIERNLEDLNSQVELTQEKIRGSQALLLGLTVLGITLCVGFIFFLGRLLIQPTRELVEAIETLTKSKNLDTFIPHARPDEIGAVASALQVLIDRIKKTRTEDARVIKQLERRSDQAMNSIPDALFLAEATGKILYFNETAKEILQGRKCEHVQDLPWPSTRAFFETCVLRKNPQVSMDFEKALQIFVDGNEKFFLPGAYPVFDEQGVVEEVTILMSDISYLRQLDEMKTDLMATVSHQLKTPLTCIMMSLHMLVSGQNPALTDTERDLLATAMQESERLHSTIQHLLDMARIQSGAIEMQLEEVEIEPWLREIARQYAPILQDRRISFAIDFDGSILPQRIDRVRMAAVVDNLMSNCAKYCRPGDGVTLRAGANPNNVEAALISVIDNGPGIPAADVSRVFDKFYRRANPNHGGAGLGLAIARQIVHAHGGEIHCTSDEGKGANFTIELYPSKA